MPDTLPALDEERDFLFDIRTGYCVLDKECGHFDDHPYGEGDPKIYVIVRAKREDVPAQWSDWIDGSRSRIRKLDLAQAARDFDPANRITSGLLANVYRVKATFTGGSDADFTAERAKYDTKQNAVRTTGTGYTFATIQGNINAGASGDVAAVYGNGATPLVSGSYNENITDNALDGIQLIGMLPVRPGTMLPGVRIHANAGSVISIIDNHSWLVENFELDGEGSAWEGLDTFNAWMCVVARCVVHDCDHGFEMTGSSDGTRAYNCFAYDCDDGFVTNDKSHVWVHCTAVDNTGVGFQGLAADECLCQCCLASDNGTDYANAFAGYNAWNVSSDLTAPGAGARTGFNNANFANYAGDDFRLAAAGENGANIDGWPLVDADYMLNTREKDTLIFYAGAHDPYVPPSGTAPTCTGIVDATPAAQGSIWIRFWEMCCAEGTEPYRYDVHVKRWSGGPLTADEINNKTYYARSFHADELYGCGGAQGSGGGGSGGTPGILQALIAFEAPGDIDVPVIPNDENMHLFTSRRYWVAVRAVAINDEDTIFEDDNVAVALSYSSGHQGELWTQILDCVAIEPCTGSAHPMSIQGTVSASTKITSLPDIEFGESIPIPPLDMIHWAGDMSQQQQKET